MRFAVIACQVMQREINYLAARSKHIITPHFLQQGLHCTPSRLNQSIADEITKIRDFKNTFHEWEFYPPDAILLGYGLCSNGIIGLTGGDLPIVVPRTDDCIGIFLGSQKRYLDYFNSHNGIYWFNPGWIETSFMPSEENYQMQWEKYAELYGEDNADYLIEETNGWHSKYSFGTYINSPIVDNQPYKEFTKTSLQHFNWEYDEVDGDMNLLENLLSGNWNEEDFLVCPPHHTIVETFDERKIKAVPNEEESK